jgi:tRNA-dihydrouridine synthase
MRWTRTYRFRSAQTVITAVRRELATLPVIAAGAVDDSRIGIEVLRTTQLVMAAAWRRCVRTNKREVVAVLFAADARRQLWMDVWADQVGTRDREAAAVYPAYRDMACALRAIERGWRH